MEKNRTTKIIAIVALCVAVIGTTVAFAAMSTTLKINGSANMDTAKWDIHFDTLTGPAIAGDATVVTAPTLENTHFGNYAVKLTKPGDSVTYTFNVTNGGDIDATLGTYTKATPTFTGASATDASSDQTTVNDNLVYTLVYSDTKEEVKEKDPLAKNSSRNLTLTIGYKSDAIKLPTDDVSISGMDITMIYNQVVS